MPNRRTKRQPAQTAGPPARPPKAPSALAQAGGQPSTPTALPQRSQRRGHPRRSPNRRTKRRPAQTAGPPARPPRAPSALAQAGGQKMGSSERWAAQAPLANHWLYEAAIRSTARPKNGRPLPRRKAQPRLTPPSPAFHTGIIHFFPRQGGKHVSRRLPRTHPRTR